MKIRVKVKQALADLKRKRELLKSLTYKEVKKEANQTARNLAAKTPRKWSGKTRKAWRVIDKSGGNKIHFRVENPSPVMAFLEFGTKERRPRKSRHLFIPLRKSAWRKGGYRKGMKYGRDFIFAKKARGIKAIRLLPVQIKRTRQRLRSRLGKASKKIQVSG